MTSDVMTQMLIPTARLHIACAALMASVLPKMSGRKRCPPSVVQKVVFSVTGFNYPQTRLNGFQSTMKGCIHVVTMLPDRIPAYLSYLLVQFCSGGLTLQWETSSSLKANVNFQQISSHWPHQVKLVDAMWTPQIWMGKAI